MQKKLELVNVPCSAGGESGMKRRELNSGYDPSLVI